MEGEGGQKGENMLKKNKRKKDENENQQKKCFWKQSLNIFSGN